MLDDVKSSLVAPVASVLCALLIGAIVIMASGFEPWVAYQALFQGAFGNVRALGNTLTRSTPIIFTGLAIAVAFKGGMFNIGAEGQIMLGAIGSAMAGHLFTGLPMVVHLPLTVLCGIASAALWGFIPGILKSLKGVHEVISSIMMNYIALSVGSLLIESVRVGDLASTPPVLPTAFFLRFYEFMPVLTGIRLNIGFVLAIIAALVMHFVMKSTVLGFEINSIGFNASASEDAGIDIKKRIVVIFFISSILAGLGGVERTLGVHRTYMDGTVTNFGFEGIAVALLANNNPIGIIFSAVLFGALASGGHFMNMAAGVPVDVVGVIQGLIILFAASHKMFHFISARKVKGAAK